MDCSRQMKGCCWDEGKVSYACIGNAFCEMFYDLMWRNDMLTKSGLGKLLVSTETYRVERTKSTTAKDKFGEAVCACRMVE